MEHCLFIKLNNTVERDTFQTKELFIDYLEGKVREELHEEMNEYGEETIEHIDATKIIEQDALDNDTYIDDILGHYSKQATKATTELIIHKYNKFMAMEASKTKVPFYPLNKTPREDLPELLSTFFLLARTKTGEIYNASSLRRYLVNAYNPPIDIHRDPHFKKLRMTVKMMQNRAADTQGKNGGCNQASLLSPAHLQQAWDKGTMGRDTPDGLVAAVYCALTIGLGCLSIKEIVYLQNKAVIFGPIGKGNVPEWIELGDDFVRRNRKIFPNSNERKPGILEARCV